MKKKILSKFYKLRYKIKSTINQDFFQNYSFDLHKYTDYILNKWRNTQDNIEKSFKLKGHNEALLKQSNVWIKSVTWVLIGTSSFSILWLCFAKTEEIIVSTGRLVPKGKVHEIRIPSGGVAEEILVKAGDKVKAGEILIQLDPEISTQEVLSIDDEIKEVKSQLTQFGIKLKIDSEILEKYKLLVEEGAVSKLQYLKQMGEVEQIKSQRAGIRAKIAQLQSQLTNAKVNLKYKSLRAPVNGVVFDLKPTSKGFVAQTSEPVMKIVPFDDLEADVEIPSNKIGFVKLGMPAEISIDSFPATDFGVLKGKVETIGSDALAPNQAELRPDYRYPAVISLNSQSLELTSGQNLPLQVGMSLTANIKLRDVTYIQLLLSKFKNKTDTLKKL